MDKKYNGWTNYETWNVHLWLTNDETTHTYWQEQARNIQDLESFAAQIEKEVKDNSPLVEECSLYSDILSANLSEIDWYEIAQNLREERHENTI